MMKKLIAIASLIATQLSANTYLVVLDDKFYHNSIVEEKLNIGVEFCTYTEGSGHPNNSPDGTFDNVTMYYSNTNSFTWDGQGFGRLRAPSNSGQAVIIKDGFKYYAGDFVWSYRYYACREAIYSGSWKAGVKESDAISSQKRSNAYTYQYPLGGECEKGVRNYYYVQLNVKSYGMSDYHRYYQECE